MFDAPAGSLSTSAMWRISREDKFIKDFEGFDFADSAQEINGRNQLLRQLYRMLFWWLVMRKRQRDIRVKYGQFEFVKLNAQKFDLRDTYHLVLTLSWPGFAGLVFGIYLLINVVFAWLYMLKAHAIAEMAPGSFLDAFFFSVETLATVGYGHMYPETFYGHLITMLEIMVGMFGLAVITGLIFVRFSRPTARMQFSKVAVISPFDGVESAFRRDLWSE
jgi:inward rectifier potassium channel